ncbi:MAG: hypothetical protein ACTHK1_14970 [Actinomycetales bacterium]
MGFFRGLLAGAAAGAAGTTALNTVTYLDMVWRGRGSSSTPEQTAEKLAQLAHIDIPGEGEKRQHRIQGLGPLTGIASGVGIGALAGALQGAGWPRPRFLTAVVIGLGAMAATDLPMWKLGVTSDPRSWPASSWASDGIPHLAYGAVTSAVLRRLVPQG